MSDLGVLLAGVARADITPPVGITHLPWGAAVHDRAEGIDMELWATALVLSEGAETVALVELDLCLIDHQQASDMRAAAAQLSGVPFERVWISCTHNHSGPSLSPSWVTSGGELIPGYVHMVRDKVAGAVWQAVQHLQPARIGAGAGRSSVNVNRRLPLPDGRVVVGRNWQGYVDREVQVVRIDDLDEEPIATLVNYQAHPTIMAFGNRLITPDYPGPLRRTVEREVGGVCLFLQGCGGNAQAVLSFSNQPKDYRHTGHLLGLEAARVAIETHTVSRRERMLEVVESGAPLAVFADEPLVDRANPTRLRAGIRPATLPVRAAGEPAELARIAAREADGLQTLKDQGASADAVREQAFRAKRASMAVDFATRYAAQDSVTIQLVAVAVGSIAIVGLPGEPFMELGQAIKHRSPFERTLVCGYFNGYEGYMPTRAAYAEGGYEPEWGTAYAAGAGEITVEEVLSLLNAL